MKMILVMEKCRVFAFFNFNQTSFGFQGIMSLTRGNTESEIAGIQIYVADYLKRRGRD